MKKNADQLSNTDVYFREVQKYRNVWIILIVTVLSFAGIYVLVLAPMVANIITGQPVGYNRLFGIPIFLIGLVVIYLLARLKLLVEVRENGVMFRFFLTNRKPRWIPKESIARFEALKFGPDQVLLDALLHSQPNRKAYYIKGDVAIRITTRNGNVVQLGTKRIVGLYHALEKIVPEAALLTSSTQTLLREGSDKMNRADK